jgi:homoserine O-acetyltransferase
MIRAQYLLVTEHLNIKHLAGVMGPSMGGFQTLQWITDYPGMMDWAIPIATGPSFTGRNVGIYGLMNQTIQSDPAYMDGQYQEKHRDGLRRAFMLTYLFYFTHSYFQTKYKTTAEVMKGLEDAGLGSAKMDANDIIWRNGAMMNYNVAANLPKVKAKTMVVGVNDDELFPPEEEFRRIAYAIPGATLFSYDSVLGHLGCALHLDRADKAMLSFLKGAERKE